MKFKTNRNTKEDKYKITVKQLSKEQYEILIKILLLFEDETEFELRYDDYVRVFRPWG